MQNIRILNSKEIKEIAKIITEQFDFDASKMFKEYAVLQNKDNRLYIISKDLGLIDFAELKIDSVGMYIGELYKGSIRLSIEGAQLIAPFAKKHIVEIDRETMQIWVKGQDIDAKDTDIKDKDFLIIKSKNPISHNEEILGCGKYRDGKIMNYVSKSRRLVVVNS